MLFVSILFAISISQEIESHWDRDFKHNTAAVELFQKMEGEWKFEKAIEGGEQSDDDGLVSLINIKVSDWAINALGLDSEQYKIAAFDSDLNTFKIMTMRRNPDGRSGLATVKEDELILVYRIPEFGKTPLVIEPNKENNYYVFKRK